MAQAPRGPEDELPPISERPSERRRIKQLEVMVADVVVETHDTATLVLFTGNDRLDYEAGHFLTIDPHQFEALERFIAYFEDLKGRREPPRAYSMCSAPHERYLAVTIKEERYVSGLTRFPPLLSPLLVKRTPRGTRLVVTGFTGPYTLSAEAAARTDHLVHVCAGSGAVPNLSIVKHALREHLKLRHTFLISNRTWADVIFKPELEQLQAAHPDRLRVVHSLTREPNAGRFAGDVRQGRVNGALLKELIPDPTSCLVYACGPAISTWDRQRAKETGEAPAPRFMETVLEELAKIGVPRDRVTRESYG